MKRITLSVLMIVLVIGLIGCTAENTNTPQVSQEVSYEDGTYRGTFSDGGAMQVGVQFKLEKNIVKEAEMRHLEYRDTNYLKEEADETVMGLTKQYEELLGYLVDKDIRESIASMYEPGDIIKEEVDGFTGATIRAGKIISAVRDGLNRGVYSY